MPELAARLEQLNTVFGVELAERIRQIPDLASTPILMLTSAGEPDDIARCRELGIAFVVKPIDPSRLKETLVAVRKDVEAGISLSDAMGRHPKVFSPLFVAMTQAGEAGGVLEGALMRVADQLEKDASLRRQIKAAMVYPTLVIIFAGWNESVVMSARLPTRRSPRAPPSECAASAMTVHPCARATPSRSSYAHGRPAKSTGSSARSSRTRTS